MNDKTLNDKAILIKNKKYVLVSDRVLFFNENYPNGCIQTKLVSEPKDERIVIKAKIIPDVKNPERYFTAYSQEVVGDGYINKTSALENADTSAVGRALGMMGIGVLESIASADEMNKAVNQSAIQDNSAVENGEPVPDCSVCGKPMRKSKTGKFYCRHMEGGQVVWGEKIYKTENSPKEKEFLEDINANI